MKTISACLTCLLLISLLVPVQAEEKSAFKPAEQDWTQFERLPDARVIYVSTSTGSDTNRGDTIEEPVRSLERALQQVRSGTGDWLLLRAGDTWEDNFGVLEKSGASGKHPFLIGAYGEGPRPVIRPGDKAALRVLNKRVEHVAIVGLRFEAPENPIAKRASGMSLLGPLDDMLIEDCVFQGFAMNLNMNAYAGPVRNIRLRRTFILDSLNLGEDHYEIKSGHSSGLFANKIEGLSIEECVFDQNGWREGVKGAERSKFNHNVYIQFNCSDVIFRKSISARASNSAIMVRCGGIVEDNLVLASPSAIAIGSNKGDGIMYRGTVRNNVILHSTDLGESGQGWGITMTRTESSLVENNIVAHARGKSARALAYVNATRNATARGNIAYRTGSPFLLSDTLENVALHDNVLVTPDKDTAALRVQGKSDKDALRRGMTGNRFFVDPNISDDALMRTSQRDMDRNGLKYTDVRNDALCKLSRTIETYQESLSGKSGLDGFLHEVRNQSRNHWRSELQAVTVNAYFRESFSPLKGDL